MAAADEPAWSHELLAEADGTFRVEVVDEDGARVPVGRKLSQEQARLLVKRIAAEAQEARRPIRAVIRDAHFMAATILTVKRSQ